MVEVAGQLVIYQRRMNLTCVKKTYILLTREGRVELNSLGSDAVVLMLNQGCRVRWEKKNGISFTDGSFGVHRLTI